jgi:hypothetical protein
LANQPMNLGQQFGGQTINPMFHADRAPQRYMEVYQQAPDPQPPIGKMPMLIGPIRLLK